LNAARIRQAKLVANPGCYPTASALALLPLARAGLIEEPVVVTALSGVSGAGREASEELHFPEMNESARAYKVGSHRHEPEIAETLSYAAGAGLRVAFTPHIVPMNRGILATVHAKPKGLNVHGTSGSSAQAPAVGALEAGELTDLYRKHYAGEPFVRVVEREPDTKHVRNTNYCDVKPHAANAAGYYVVTSAIDNLVKGGAGQAIENMNVMFGLDRAAGLPVLGGGP
ncbi:MAG TPA: N-acetyl-gamma-glutamyl-phosphate reductase, partial [Candidatus Thermoplasmatota archaeon]|nr:N-acetyl-gamma-glutamyl-phosphate reductase [Candidatus Thermoplasmatota archaeon]